MIIWCLVAFLVGGISMFLLSCYTEVKDFRRRIAKAAEMYGEGIDVLSLDAILLTKDGEKILVDHKANIIHL